MSGDGHGGDDHGGGGHGGGWGHSVGEPSHGHESHGGGWGQPAKRPASHGISLGSIFGFAAGKGGHGDGHGGGHHVELDPNDPQYLLKKYHFVDDHHGYKEETDEIEWQAKGLPTGYPQVDSALKYHLIYETNQQYIEEHYYWILHNLRYDHGFTHYDKITDVFAASEHSSFFGVSEQRLAIQQDRIAQFLRGISEMLKALFQLVREIRIIDERLTFYNDSFHRGEEAQGSEITLKGIWVDQVEGGVKNAGSVYGLAQTVGFSILPDLFFRLKINDGGMDRLAGNWEAFTDRSKGFPKQIDELVGRLDFNEKVKEVLRRKLVQYYIWKTRTYKELTVRKRFTVKYLRQHYDTIRLYMGWIKPYLRNARKLRMDQRKMDSYELLSAFEGSMLEIEVLLSRRLPDQVLHPCLLLTFFFRTRPAMGFVGEGYQRGPTHVGKMDMTIRGYVWTEQQINNYKNMRMEEDFELLSTIDESLKEALDSLGEELKAYLMSEGERFPERPTQKHDEHPHQPGMLDPFISVFTGISSIAEGFGKLGGVFPQKKEEGVKDIDGEEYHVAKQWAKNHVKKSMWLTWKNFKKTNNMLQW